MAAGAVAGAILWAHPDFLWPNPAPTQATARAVEPAAPTVSPAAPAGEPAAPAAGGRPAADSTSGGAAASPLKPAFDVVNVEPTGEAVVAGRAAPNARVELRDAGKTVAEATADASGQFVIIPPALAPGDHSLSLAEAASEGTPETSEPVAVSVPAPETKTAAAAAPAASLPALTTRTLAAPPPDGASRVTIRSVEADSAGGLIAKGSAGPNATVRLYLNGSNVADARTQSDGRWSLTIKRGMTPGGYVMHADEINPGNATVVASANTQFNYPATPPSAPPTSLVPAAQPSPPLASVERRMEPPGPDAVVDEVQTALVVHGHTLWALSRNYYGDPTRYHAIYEANKWEIHNPDLIYPGEVFLVPKSEPKP